MDAYIYTIIIFIGLALGSFFNVVIFRFNTSLSPTKGRSRCASCKSVLRWFDLVPIFSYLILGGKCRRCKKEISPLYLIVESTTAMVFLLLFLNLGMQESLFLVILDILIISILLLIAFIDSRHFIIPDKLLIPLAIAIIGSKLHNPAGLGNLLTSALGLSAFFAILFLVSKGRWLGFGDIKLVFLIGFLFGYPVSFLAIMLSVWTAAVFSIVLMIIGKANLKTEIPFGFFMSMIAIVFIIFNDKLQEISKYFY